MVYRLQYAGTCPHACHGLRKPACAALPGPKAACSSIQNQRPYRSVAMPKSDPSVLPPRKKIITAVAAPPAPSSTEGAPVHKPMPSSVSNPAPGPIDQAAMGLRFYSDGSTTFRVWAPHASYAVLQIAPPQEGPPPPQTTPEGESPSDTAPAPPVTPWQPKDVEDVPMERVGDTWAIKLPPGRILDRSPYRVLLHTGDGTVLERR
jgi:hypothetical protein